MSSLERLGDAVILDALIEADNALSDYVERLEKQGGMMNYGHAVLVKVRRAIQLMQAA